MDAPMPSDAELTAIPRSRDVVSFHLGVDRTGRFINMKVLTAGGSQECLLLAAPIVLHLRDRFRETLRASPSLEVLPTDEAFFARRPTLGAEDWNTGSGHVGVPIGAHVLTRPDGCVLAFPMDRDAGSWTAFRLRPLHAAYFLHAINDAEENEDFGKRPPLVSGETPVPGPLH